MIVMVVMLMEDDNYVDDIYDGDHYDDDDNYVDDIYDNDHYDIYHDDDYESCVFLCFDTKMMILYYEDDRRFQYHTRRCHLITPHLRASSLSCYHHLH